MSVSNEVALQIQSEVNIVDIISQYVQLKKRGKNFFGFCPFHEERTPSFSVAEEKQMFYCFSCGKGGNVFNFISELDSVSFTEAVAKVVELAGLSYRISTENAGQKGKYAAYQPLYDAHERAANFYQYVLNHTKGGEAPLQYLQERGYTKETIETYGLGYAPSNRTLLVQQMKEVALTPQQVNETGLFVRSEESGQIKDRFYQRVMIPLRDENGKVIAFSGRTVASKTGDELDEPVAKYLNSPETPLFNKRNFLFNFDIARSAIRKAGVAVLFEGYMDVIAAYQAGIPYGVASMGTSLTPEQIGRLNKVTDRMIIAYDGDRAGMDATNRAIELLRSHSSAEISIFPLDSGLDPDEYIQRFGAEAFQEKIMHHTETVFQFKKRYLQAQFRMDVEKEKIELLHLLIKELVVSTSLIERDLMMTQLSTEFGVSVSTIYREIQLIEQQAADTRKKQPKKVNQVPTTVISPLKETTVNDLELAQRQLLYRLIHSPHIWSTVATLDDSFSFPTKEFQQLYEFLKQFRRKKSEEWDLSDVLIELEDKQLKSLLVSIDWKELPEECTQQEIQDLVYFLSTKQQLDQKEKEIEQQLKKALERGDRHAASALLQQKVELKRQRLRSR